MEGKQITELVDIGLDPAGNTLLNTDADLIVVQDGLTRRTKVGSIVNLLMQPESLSEGGTIVEGDVLVTSSVVNTTISQSLEPVISRVTVAEENIVDINNTISNYSDVSKAFEWGNHASQGYEDTDNKGMANGYAGLDGNTQILVANVPTLPASKIPTALNKNTAAWNEVSLDDTTNYTIEWEYRILFEDGNRLKMSYMYPYKVDDTRLQFMEFYVRSDSKAILRHNQQSDLDNAVIKLEKRYLGA